MKDFKKNKNIFMVWSHASMTWFSHFKQIKYIVQTGMTAALLVAIGMTTAFIKISDNVVFQAADGVYLALIPLIPGPMMLVAGLIYPTIIDLAAASFITIPAGIIVHILMFVVCKTLAKLITGYGAIPIACSLVLIYVLNAYLINLSTGTAHSAAITELTIDGIQYGVSTVFGVALFWAMNRKAFKKFLADEFPDPQAQLKVKMAANKNLEQAIEQQHLQN
ncbi:hypothetical protein [Williamsoniiplasma lucivorax]|uniref:Uncharacterized protein n=1 Tax=Williamsoniiplasma lucivorax TaxID=209274 RepID=A0A2S5RCZ6_9MOLU|nr:hypothetical protein [Williamsoniiplasma lucivorax]PPE05211.1 hypothetical protein ELUCI_v1c07470 [Williamsoniiplasma lucivorax]